MPKKAAPTPKLKPGHVYIEIIEGPVGPSLYIGDEDGGHRLAGPKPWGGGAVLHQFQVKTDELSRELQALIPKDKS